MSRFYSPKLAAMGVFRCYQEVSPDSKEVNPQKIDIDIFGLLYYSGTDVKG